MRTHHATRENTTRLAADRVPRRTDPERLTFPPRPSRASLPDPLTPDDLAIAQNAAMTTRLATERYLAMSVEVNGKDVYDDRREGRGPVYALQCWLLQQYNAGMSEGEYSIVETSISAFGRRLYRGVVRRSLAAIKALETRYQGECDALMMDIDRRIAEGEPESPEMYRALKQAVALHVAHGIELFNACDAKEGELRRAATVRAHQLTVVTP